jgi:Transposase DDE domain
LLFVLLCMTWCTGDSLPERFETARAFYVALHQRRRRPGKTFAGFEKALAALPMPVLRAVARAVRGRLVGVFAACFTVDEFIPLGCDGSRLACPHSQELERRLRLSLGKKKKRKRRRKKTATARAPVSAEQPREGTAATKTRAAGTPQLWVTAVLHLGLGVLWSWRLGTGNASEREHLRLLLDTLPRGALLVADAGYVGYHLMACLQDAGFAYLLRLSSCAPLYVPDKSMVKNREGLVYYWPQEMQKQDLPPLPVRLWRLRGERGDIWLISNVLDEQRLPRRTAGKFYRWRWRNEVYQANCTSSASCCRSIGTGYDSGRGVAGIGQMDGATRQESSRRIGMFDNSHTPIPPRPNGSRRRLQCRWGCGPACRHNGSRNSITCSVR